MGRGWRCSTSIDSLVVDCFRADHGAPAIAGVLFSHSHGDVGGLFAQIFLVDGAVFVDDEGHDS
jgi:hypothetical protein